MFHQDDLCKGCVYYHADYSTDDYDCECPDISDEEKDIYFSRTDGCPYFSNFDPEHGPDLIDMECLEYEIEAERKVRDRQFAELMLGGEC